MTRRTALAVALLAVAGPAVPASSHSAHDSTPGATVFDRPVKVSPELGSARDSDVVVDRWGNVFVTAVRDSASVVAARDERSETQVRTSSWAWTSADGGATWANLPGLGVAGTGRLVPGLATDLALDGKNRLYVADANAADLLVTRYDPDARGRVPLHAQTPVGTASPDLRVRLAAQGDGRVYAVVHPSRSPISVAPRLHASIDGGRNWDHVGIELVGAARCRPATDTTTVVVVTCTNASGSLLAYSSADGGRTFTRSVMGKHQPTDSTSPAPIPAVVGSTVYALHVDSDKVEGSVPVSSRITLYTSRDRGRSWTVRDITVDKGRYAAVGFAASRTGRLAIGAYWQPAPGKPWQVVGGIHQPGKRAYLSKFGHDLPVAVPGDAPDSDAIGVAFAADGTMCMTFTLAAQLVEDVPEQPSKEVWFVRSVLR